MNDKYTDNEKNKMNRYKIPLKNILDTIDVVRGIFFIEDIDIVIDNIGIPFGIKRKYISNKIEEGTLGKGWSFNYETRIEIINNIVNLYLPNGDIEKYTYKNGYYENIELKAKNIIFSKDSITKQYIVDMIQEDLKYVYSIDGKLLSIEDKNKNKIKINYIKDSKLIDTVENLYGRKLYFTYVNEKVYSIKDNIGRSIEYKYDNGMLIEVNTINNATQRYIYNKNGFISEIYNLNGDLKLKNTYNNEKKVIYQYLCGTEYEITYDNSHNKTIVFNKSLSSYNTYHYNTYCLITEIQYNDASSEKYEYDKWKNKTVVINRKGALTKYLYNEYGKLILKTNADESIEKYEYDINNNLIKSINVSGQQILYFYDRQGNIIEKQEQTYGSQYAVTRKEYDSYGRLTKIINPIGGEIIYKYETMDTNPTKTSNLYGNECIYTYDKVGRMTSKTTLYGVEEYAYNYNDKISTVKDRLGNIKRNYYDLESNLIEEIFPEEFDKANRENSRALGWKYEYNLFSQITSKTDPLGNKTIIKSDLNKKTSENIKIEYDCMNRIKIIKDAYDNITNEYIYDKGRMIKEINSESYAVEYKYNDIGWVIQKLEPKTKHNTTNEILYSLTLYSYNKIGQITEERKSKDYVTKNSFPNSWIIIKNEYNKYGYIIKTTNNTGSEIVYTYDKDGNLTKQIYKINDIKAKTLKFTYTKTGFLEKVIHEMDSEDIIENCETAKIEAIKTYKYDRNGNIIQIRTPKEIIYNRKYDIANRLICEEITASGEQKRTTFYDYDKTGNIIKIIDTNKNILKYEYDYMNRLIKIIDKQENITKLCYDNNSNIIKKIQPENYNQETDNGLGTSYEYDLNNRLVKIVNELGYVIQENEYNLDGELISQINNNLRTDFILDIGKRRTHIITSKGGMLGEINKYIEYDALDNIIGIKDGESNYIRYYRDNLGRVEQITKPNNSIEKYTYDYIGNLTSSTDGNGNTTFYQYNSLNKLSKVIDPNGKEELFYYDTERRIVLYVDKNKNKIKYTYNYDNNIKQIREITNELTGRKRFTYDSTLKSYSYNSDGTMNRASANGITYRYKYDKNQNLVQKQYNDDTILLYKYNKNNYIKAIEDIKGNNIKYKLDILNRIVEIEYNNNIIANYYYDNSNLRKIKYKNGLVIEYNYDEYGNLTSLYIKLNEKIIVDNTYIYDNNGNIIEKTLNDDKFIYIYNNIQKIKEIKHINSTQTTKEVFKYDNSGNLISKNINEKQEQYFYDNCNRLISFQTPEEIIKYEYDNQGNIILQESKNGKKIYNYDVYNKLIEIKMPDGSIYNSKSVIREFK